ncbi:MAG TPA: hypothetical protein VIF62_26200 [Labilithrix sp.]
MALFAAALALGSCSGKDPYNPGQGIGTFHVTSTLVSSSCGTVPNPWEFDVKLRHDAQTVYWVQGGAPVQGKLDAHSNTSMTSSTSTTLRDANAQTHVAACVVTRTDSVAFALDTTDPSAATALSGTLGYRFDPDQGSDCADQTLDSGGDFAALPCDVSYTITAKKTGDLK